MYENKEIQLINQKLIYDYIDQNKFEIYSYIFLILFTYPLNSVVISNLFSDLLDSFSSPTSFSKSQKDFMKSPKGILVKIILLFLFTTCMVQLLFEKEKIIFPDYVSFLHKTLRIGTLKSRMENFEEINVGESLTRITDVVYDLELLLKEISNRIIPFLLKLLLVNGFYFHHHKNFAFLNICLDFIRFYILYRYTVGYKTAAYQKFDAFFLNARVFSTTFENIFHIVINNEVENEIENQSGLSEELKGTIKKQMDEKRKFIGLSNLLSIICFLIKFIFLLDLFVKKKEISKKVFTTILLIEFGFINDWKDISYTYLSTVNTYEGIRNGSADLYKILIETDKIQKPFLPITSGEIRLVNVQFCFDQLLQRCIFDSSTYTFENGQKYILQGPSGSGKSSLIGLILKLIPVSSGELTIGGSKIEDIPTPQIRQIVTMIPQRNSLFVGLTMKENLLYGTNASDETLNEILDRYPLSTEVLLQGSDRSTFLERKYDGSNASGGQKRVIINIRGVLRSREFKSLIVICDEPLVGLNDEVVYEMIRMIQNEFKQQTVLLIEHLLKQNPDYLTELNSNSDHLFQTVDMSEIHSSSS